MTNEEFNDQFRKRTKAFSVAALKFCDKLDSTASTKVISYQLAKSSTSVGANYRAFCRGRSRNERYSKICIVVEEADETVYWLGILQELGKGDQQELAKLITESNEILKVVAKTKSSHEN